MNFLYATLGILVINSIAHFYTVVHLTAVTALKQIDAEFEAVSASLRVPFYKTLMRVTVPICMPAILDIAIYLFLNAMTTVSAVIFLYSSDTKLASVAVVNMDEAGFTAAAAAMATMIVITSAGIKLLQVVLNYALAQARAGLAPALGLEIRSTARRLASRGAPRRERTPQTPLGGRSFPRSSRVALDDGPLPGQEGLAVDAAIARAKEIGESGTQDPQRKRDLVGVDAFIETFARDRDDVVLVQLAQVVVAGHQDCPPAATAMGRAMQLASLMVMSALSRSHSWRRM